MVSSENVKRVSRVNLQFPDVQLSYLYRFSATHFTFDQWGVCEPKLNLNEANAKVYGQNPQSEGLILAL